MRLRGVRARRNFLLLQKWQEEKTSQEKEEKESRKHQEIRKAMQRRAYIRFAKTPNSTKELNWA